MKIIDKIDYHILDNLSLEIHLGKIISYATDTLYAISGDASSQSVVDKIYKIKNRDKNKSLPIIIDYDIKLWKNLFIINDRQIELIINYLANVNKNSYPISFAIYKNKTNLLAENISNNNKIVFRVIDNIFLRSIFHLFKKPLIATSLNISGQDNILNSKDIKDNLSNKINYFIDIDSIKYKHSSNIIDISDIDNIKIIR